MPKIEVFDAGKGEVRPTETGVQSVAAAARRVGAAYNEVSGSMRDLGRETAALGVAQGHGLATLGKGIGSAISSASEFATNYADHQQISQGALAAAGFLDAHTKQWDDAVKAADPNDPTVATKFRDQTEKDFDKFCEAFTTDRSRQWAENRIQTMRQHFFEKTASDMSGLAAKAATQNVQGIADKLSSTAARSADFHTVDYLLGTIKGEVGAIFDTSPNLRGAEAAKSKVELEGSLRNHIIKSGAAGAIERSDDPVATSKAWLEKYPELADDAGRLGKAAEGQVRAQRAQQAYEKRVANDEIKQQSAQRLDDLRTSLIDDPRSVKPRDVVNDRALTPTDKNHALKFIEQATKQTAIQATVSAKNYVELTERINRPPGDPERINDEGAIHSSYGDGKISRADYTRALKEFRENRTPDGETFAKSKRFFMDTTAKPQLLKGAFDPVAGSVDLARYMHHVDDMIDAYRRENKNPRELFNPKSPDYLGNPDIINGFKTPLSQQIEGYSKRFATPSVPAPSAPQAQPPAGAPQPPPQPNDRARRPGESLADYDRRTGRMP